MRVSTEQQCDARQEDALTEAGCARIFTDHGVSSVKHRPALEDALAYLRPGDTLVVRELDRLGRRTLELLGFIEDLHARDVGLRILTLGIDTRTPAGALVVTMMAAMAQLEHSLLKERVVSGLAAARSRGRVGGRPRVMTDKQVDHARRLRDQDGESLREIARLLGVAESTLRRRLAAAEAD